MRAEKNRIHSYKIQPLPTCKALTPSEVTILLASHDNFVVLCLPTLVVVLISRIEYWRCTVEFNFQHPRKVDITAALNNVFIRIDSGTMTETVRRGTEGLNFSLDSIT